jgi:chromate transporter
MLTDETALQPASVAEIFFTFLRLGLTSFGGPVAHLGYFHQALVVRRRWLDEHHYADLVALCQFLPGPASSQVGIAIGLTKAGWRGAVAAWFGFTFPSAVLMTIFGLSVSRYRAEIPAGLLHGLMLVAVPVVAQAVWLMARQLCPDWTRRVMALCAAVAFLLLPSSLLQPLIIAAGGIAGLLVLKPFSAVSTPGVPAGPGKRTAGCLLAVFVVLLLVLPFMGTIFHNQALSVFSGFYRAGALVFGGGHVILPLLQAAVVPQGWVSNDAFLTGYGAAQAMPGPLFSFAAYLGTVIKTSPNGPLGAALCLTAIYLPSFLLIAGALPFWTILRHRPNVRSVLAGVNATVVGLLVAALYNPVWTSAIHSSADILIAIIGLCLLMLFNTPSWLVVLMSATIGWLLHP